MVADSTECKTDAIIGWFKLIVTFASMRFDDLLHVAPSSGRRAWRAWRGAPRSSGCVAHYVVCRASLSGEDWPVAGSLSMDQSSACRVHGIRLLAVRDVPLASSGRGQQHTLGSSTT